METIRKRRVTPQGCQLWWAKRRRKNDHLRMGMRPRIKRTRGVGIVVGKTIIREVEKTEIISIIVVLTREEMGRMVVAIEEKVSCF